jgi:hypothetical protein
MRNVLATCSLFFTLCPLSLAAQEIVSVIPSIVTVGTTVTVSGGPFAPDVRIVVGEREVVPSRPGEQQMVFVVPPLESGEYALMLKSDGQVSPSPFSLRVVEAEPRIAAVSPGNIDECSSANERRVTVLGEAFSPSAQLLLDGAAIPVENIGETEINFIAPPLDGGLHHVQVVNPGDRKSLAFALFVNSLPEIHSVELGPDAVTHYELTIRGKNFLFNSTLVVDGISINPVLVAGGTQVFMVPAVQPGNDTVRYIDCNTMVYTRHPVSRQAKRVSMQIVNPDGQPSPLFHLTIP